MKNEIDYMWEKQLVDPISKKDIDNWKPLTGPIVIDRNDDNTAKTVRFQLLVDNPNQDIFLLCNANNWQANEEFRFIADEHSIYYTLDTSSIKHNDSYMLLVNAGERRDPASYYFSNEGKCIFFDFDDPTVYKMEHDKQNMIEKSLKILQTDLFGFVYHWKHKSNNTFGKDIPKDQTLKFIVESGILEHVGELGFNAIQFLPFAQSIDGINWKHRYLVVYHYALNNIYGTIEDFMRFVDECHRLGIGVIDDVVLGHMPDRDYDVFGKIGDLHYWNDRHGTQLFMDDETSWGTRRPNFNNSHLRKYLTDSCVHYIKNFKIDGFRIDNVDGILRFGPAGQGEDRPGGREFLRELANEIYSYHQTALVSYEAHYFHEDNAKMLVAPLDSDNRALAGTAYNSSRLTHFLHKTYMLKTAKESTMWKIKHIADEKDWGKSNSCIADFHNHDAAAGLMYGRATGAYAYKCMVLDKPELHKYAIGKLKVMEGLISFMAEGRTLDLMQSFLLQEGTFEHDTGILWGTVFENRDAKKMQDFKRDINKVMDEKAFWPINNHTRKFTNVDDNCKMVCLTRHDDEGNKFIVVINFSDFEHDQYCIGVEDEGSYECIFNSDERKYAGSGVNRYYSPLQSQASDKFEFFNKEIDLGRVAAYEILVFKLVK